MNAVMPVRIRKMARPLPSIFLHWSSEKRSPVGDDDIHIYTNRALITRGMMSVRVSPMQRLMFLAIATHGVISVDSLVEVLYGQEEDGGPDTAQNVVRAQMCHLRSVAMSLGLIIRRNGNRGYSMYAIEAPMRITVDEEEGEDA